MNAAIVALNSATLPSQVFTFLVVTYDGANIGLYENGIFATSVADARPMPAYSSTLTIGGEDSDCCTMSGVADEAAVYNYALSAAQVAAHYAAGRP